jgi:CRP-like cAMP-binding protein
MAEASIRSRVAESELFAGLAADFIDYLAAHAALRQVRKDAVVFRYGDRADHFYLVSSGHIAVEVAAIAGPVLELQDLGPGAVVGWSWLIPPHRWNFNARAMSPAEVIEFDGNAVLARCEEDPRFGYELLKRFATLMSERLSFARQKMMEAWSPAGFA